MRWGGVGGDAKPSTLLQKFIFFIHACEISMAVNDLFPPRVHGEQQPLVIIPRWGHAQKKKKSHSDWVAPWSSVILFEAYFKHGGPQRVVGCFFFSSPHHLLCLCCCCVRVYLFTREGLDRFFFFLGGGWGVGGAI